MVPDTFSAPAQSALRDRDDSFVCTSNHTFWSEDYQTFVEASALRPGDKLSALNGSVTVGNVATVPGTEPVFNLEIFGQHVYRVSLSAVLTHNVPTPRVKGTRGGETPAAAKGRQVHKDKDYGPGFEKEYELPSGKKADAVNVEKAEVIETKPNNPPAIRKGERQVEVYRKELEDVHGKPFTAKVETYD
jgi:hypothetical protein